MNNNLKKIGTINYKNGKYTNIFMISNFIFFALIGSIFSYFSGVINDNILDAKWILLGCISYIILHEVIHLAFIKFFSKEKINVSIKFPTISVGSDAIFNKKQFSIIALAPVIILGGIIALLVIIVPKGYIFLCITLLTLNFASSGGDYLQFYLIRNYSAKTYFQDNSKETIVYQK